MNPPDIGDFVESKKNTAQRLYARGEISLEEYNVLGKHYGFVQQPAAKTQTQWHRVALLVLGALAAAGASSAEIASIVDPRIESPLQTLGKVATLIAEAL